MNQADILLMDLHATRLRIEDAEARLGDLDFARESARIHLDNMRHQLASLERQATEFGERMTRGEE